MTPPTNQPTDQPTEYVSIRLTIGSTQFERFQSIMTDVPYIAYPHTGKKGNNPHYHILVLDTKPEKYRKRIKDNLGLTTNKYVSLKLLKNGLYAGIQYCAREHTEPIVSDPSLLDHVQAAPVWVQQTLPSTSTKKCTDKDWQLTYCNFVSVAVEHAREHSLIEHSLKQVVEDLMSKTKWRPSKYMLSGGVPAFYEQDFLVRLGRSARHNMDWWTPRI